jgi:ABC-2 type transport system permease protein
MRAFSGTTTLAALALRRDRFRLSSSVLGLAVLLAGMLAAQAAEPRRALVEQAELFAGTPAIRMFGVASGASAGATVLIRGYLLLAVLAGVMSALGVVRHTRQNEETGRAELVGAAVVGRHAALAAALAVIVGANVLLAGALGLAGIVAGQPAIGSITTGVAVGAFGIVFAGVAAVAVQLASTTRGANGLAAAALGFAFVSVRGRRGCRPWAGASRCVPSAGTTGGRWGCSPSPSSCWSSGPARSPPTAT